MHSRLIVSSTRIHKNLITDGIIHKFVSQFLINFCVSNNKLKENNNEKIKQNFLDIYEKKIQYICLDYP